MRRRALIAAVAAACLCLAGAAEASAQNQSPNQDYVAMGDSYSSGNGTGNYYESTCYRSNLAYGPLIDPQIPGTFAHPACSGAQTEDFTTNSQNGFPPQVTLLGPNTDYVTFTIGGNDAGFTSALTACANPFGDCDGALDDAEDFILNDLPGILDSTYAAVRTAAPNAVVTVLGYPRIFRPNQSCSLVFSASEVNRANVIADVLSDVIRSRVQAAGPGFAYVDARTAWLGHGACESANWINGVDLGDTVGSFHPTTSGYAAYGGMAAATLLAQRKIGQSIGPNARIAFTSDRDGNAEIYAVNGNGAFPVDLTNNGAADVDPAYSPDGTKLAFASNRDGDYEIYVANSNGSGVTQLTSNAAEDREPDWAPNGEMIAFRSSRDGNAEIYKMTAAGGSPSRLTNNAAADSAPDWSPDGSEIAFERSADVFRMNSDGQGQVNLTANAAADGDPAWSTDGNSIAFESNRDGDYEIFTIGRGTPSGGGALVQRTTNGADDRDPAYSPDGQRLTFTSTRDGDAEIYTATAAGAPQARLAANPAADSAPTWQGDQSPPETAIDSGPSGPTPLTTPSFTFSASEPGSSFECRIDGGAYSPCASPHTTAPLGIGPHTFYVRATDPSGNLDPSPATRAFTVTPPPATTAITAGPTGTTGDDTPTFEFDSSDPLSTFECKIDGGAYSPCSSPHTLAHLDDGPHTFTVRGTDSNNNPDPDPPSATFTVDTTAPETTIDFGPPSPTNELRPSFEFSASEPSSTFECRFDGGGWTSCSSPHQPSNDLADGARTFEVRATDAAGNADPTPAQAAFTVDTAAPQTTITSAPPSAGDSTPTFEFTSDEPGSSFECRIDGAAFAPCGSPLTADTLTDGDHRFEVRATDAAGNADPTPAGLDFTTDATAPETSIDSGPGASTPNETVADDTPVWTFSSDDVAATFECQIDAGPWVPCDQSYTAPTLPDGAHSFRVRATDAAANTDPTPAEVSFAIDTTAPETSIDSGPSGRVSDTTPSFAFSGPGAASFECRLDGDGWSPCSSPHTSASLGEGPHSFAVRAVDAVGNADQTPATRAFTVDTTPPSTAIDGTVPADTNDSTPTFSFSSPSDNDASFECRIDSAPFAPCSSPHTTAELVDGSHSFEVRAIDAAGNSDPSPEQASFNIDTVAPETTISAEPASPGNDVTPRFAFSSDEGGASFECSVDAGPFSACTSPHDLAALPAGQHSFEVRAVDPAGNPDASPERRTFLIDTSPPDTQITSGPEGPVRSSGASFTFTSSEPGSSFACSLDGAPFAPCGGASYEDLADGPHRFAVRATDQAGNADPTPAAREFSVDRGVLDLAVSGKRKQRIKRGRVRVKLAVSAGEPVAATVAGKLKVGRTRVALKPVRANLEPGAPLKLRLAPSRRGAAKLKRALATGSKLKARIAVTATDAAGNEGAAGLRVKLR